jgi:RHS repeat-associated protein
MILQIVRINRWSSVLKARRIGRRRPWQIALQLGMLFIILMSLTSIGRGQDNSCPYCKPRVYIGLNGAFCSSGNYKMYISGTLVAAGSSACDAATYGRSNDILAGLILDVTYQIQVIGACATHINFYHIPDDYIVEVDGKEKRTIDKVGMSIGEGDGLWNFTVRKKCDCGNANAGESANGRMGSIMWDVGLGNLSDGRSAGHLSIHAESLAAYHYTPVALIYSPPGFTNEVDVIRNANYSLRQVKSPQTLADVVSINSDEYQIRFYRNADVGAKDQNGLYTFSNQPFVTWRINNTHPGFVDQLQISKIQNGVTQANLYTWNSSSNVWTLTSGGGERNESKATVIDSVTGDKTETFTVTNASAQVVSKVARTYHNYPWPEPELIREVVDPGGAALTTTYDYYQVLAEVGRVRRLKSVTNPDGSWEQYDYDASGNRVLVLRPWKDQPLATATEANSYATRTTYSNYDGIDTALDAKFVSSVEEKVAGLTIRKSTYTRVGTTINGEPAVVESETNYASSTVGLTTVTTRYHSSASDFFVNRVVSIQFPDGRKDSYTYEKGDHTTNSDPSLNEFTANPNGSAQRETITHGTVASPDGVAFKTTKETSILDQLGLVSLQESYVYTGTGYARVSWSVMDYDDRGHLTQTRRSNGTVVTITWDGDRKTADVDENGIETDYTYDTLNRVATQTRKGVAAAGGFPAQADIVTTFSYDAEGRTKNQTMAAGGLSLTKATSYDIAGRVKTETDAAGLVTTHTYTNGGRTETVTLPGGATQITDKYLDGQTKSVLGTAVVSQFFDYGVNTDSTPFTQEFIGSAGANSPRWTKTSTDWMRRTVKVEKPSFTAGTTVVQLSTYNALGQLQAESVMAGANKLQADKLYEYDALGNQTRVGSDIDASGALTLSSTDRIAESDSLLQQTGNDWFRVTTSKTYLINGDPTPTTTAIQSERLNNFPVNGTENIISEATTTDVAGNQTRTTTVVDRAGKKLTNRTDTPDSATDAVSITYNGLLQSSVPSAPVSATTFTYDALSRPLGVSDPATGSNTKAYNSTTGQLISESHGAQTTSYDYYAASDPSAGRLKTKTDPNSKKAYFNYNSRGDMVQTWGDTTYPIEYVFDAYGQRTEMHTFRAGSGWQGTSWPSATVGVMDITRWIYHEPTGLLSSKQDASMKQVLYTYDTLSRIATRRWARVDGGGNPVITTYAYDPSSAEMSGIIYSDGTQAVAFTHDRGGRQATLTDAAGAHTLTHNAAGQLQSDQIVGGLLDGVNVTIGYDGFLRRNSLQSTRNAATLGSQTYGYDASARLETVSSGSQTATYAYYPTTGLLNTTTFTGGTQLVRSYDALGRLQTIATTTPVAGTVASYTYTYNNLDQRTRVTREDNSYWSYGYNDRGELTSGKKYWSDNSSVAGQQMEYVFDSLGNRTLTKAGGDSQGLNLRQATYSANSLNQYQQRTVPGALDILGTANAAATVTVNDQPTYRRGDYFYKELPVDNTAAPAYPQVKAVGVRSGIGGAGEDAVTQFDGHIYMPKNVEVYSYDADGNLTSDGRWTYTWDAENRLSSMQAIAAVPVAAKLRLEFVYDYTSRRIQKKVYAWNVGSGTYLLQSTTKFVYDGRNLTAELDGSNGLIKTYIWGQDVSGTLQGAAGIGGLLLITEAGMNHVAGYDGNSNVTSLVRVNDGTVSASYEYDPFGNTLKSVGVYAGQNTIKFSCKYTDPETTLIYYGYRYFDPQRGGWISRDPSGESHGIDLYGFLGNNGISALDLTGLDRYREGASTRPEIKWDNGFAYDPNAKATWSDSYNWRKFGLLLYGAEQKGHLPDGTRAYRHYREATGSDLWVDYWKFYREDQRGRDRIDKEILDAKIDSMLLRKKLKKDRFDITGQSVLVQSSTENWQKAIGGHRIWGSGQVYYEPDACLMHLHLTITMEDFYNFNKGEKDIATELPDDPNGRFEVLGWAKSFYSRGTMYTEWKWKVQKGPKEATRKR